ncbi:MAG: PfkB family carbohydrate kinase, partial [Oscillospiraceae bacterium]
QTAKRRGKKIILNPSPAGRTILSCPMDIVDIFVLNEVEGEALSGEKAPDRILAILKEKYTHAEFLLTLGKNGAVYASKQETIFKSIYSTKVVDTTAAGDTFTGYFFAWYLAGNTLEEALKVASMASSIAVSRPGAAASIPTKTEVLERLASL